MRQLEDAVLELEIIGTDQETLHSRIISDMDRISDFRMGRLQQAREKTSPVLLAVFIGYLVTMVYYGINRPNRVLLKLLSLYTMFVGMVFYLIAGGQRSV